MKQYIIFGVLILTSVTSLSAQIIDTAIVKGRHIVIPPSGDDLLNLKTNDPMTDNLFNNFTVDQISLILKKSQEKIDLSAEEEARLSELLDTNNERFIKTFRRSSIIDEVVLRQAEIQYKKATDKYFIDAEAYNKKLDAYFKILDQFEAGQITTRPTEPEKAIKDFSKVIGLYDYIINEIPESKYVPDALYSKSFIHGFEEENNELGIRTLEILVRKYPNSRYDLEANWLIGEYLFNSADDAKLRRAKSHYQKVLELSALSTVPTKRYQESLYRLAWLSFKLREFNESLVYFTYLLDDIQANRELFDNNAAPTFFKTDMFEEPAQYLAVIFTELIKRDANTKKGAALEKAKSFFNRFNPPKVYEPMVYEYLGLEYEIIQEYDQAVTVYQFLLEKFPLSERSPFLAQKIIDFKDNQVGGLLGVEGLNAREDLYASKMEFFNKYNYRSDWYQFQLNKFYSQAVTGEDYSTRGTVNRWLGSEMFTTIDSLTQRFFVDNIDMDIYYALAFDGAQRADGININKPRAIEFYNRFANNVFRYINNYSKYDSVGYENTFRLAVVLDQNLSRPLEAYPYYLDVSRNPFSEKHRFQSSVNSISIAVSDLKNKETSTSKIGLNTLPRAKSIVSDSLLKDINFLAYVDTLQLSEEERRVINAYDNFARLYPHVAKSSDFLENVSLLFFSKNQLDAVADIQVILQKYYPGKPINPGYVTDLMKGYYFVNDFPMSERLAKSVYYLSNATKEQKDYAYQIWAVSIGKYAAILEERKDYIGAAAQWYRIYMETPDYAQVDAALFQTAYNFDNAKEYLKAIDIYNLLIEKFPKSTDMVFNAHQNIYANYVEMKAYSLASKQSERMFNTYRADAQKAEGYLRNAQADAVDAGDKKDAIRLAELYVDQFPTSQFAAQILFSTVALQEDMNNTEGVFDAYGKFADRYVDDLRSVEALYKRARYLEVNNRPTEALSEYERTAVRNRQLKAKKLPDNPFYASEAVFKLGEELRKGYGDIKIVYNNSDRLITQKEEFRTKYWDNQKEIIALGFQSGNLYRSVQAQYNIGETQEELSEQVAARDASEGGFRGADLINKQIEVYADAQNYYTTAYQIYFTTLGQFKSFQKQIEAINSNTEIGENLKVADSTVTLLVKLDSLVSNKTSEMLYKSAESKTKVAYAILNDKSPLAGIDDPNLYMIVSAALIDDSSIDIQESIALYRKNMDLSAENNIENEWVQLSRQKITDLSDLKAQRYEELVLYSIEAFDKVYTSFTGMVQVDVAPEGDEIFEQEAILTTNIENGRTYVSKTIEEYAIALQIVDANNLGKDLRRQVEERATQFLYTIGNKQVDRSDGTLSDKRRWERTAEQSNYEKYWYSDGALTLENVAFSLKETGMEILQQGIGFMDGFGVFTNWTGKIITKLIATNPLVYGPLLGDIDLRSSLVVLSDESWKMSTIEAENWTSVDFSDSLWSYADVLYTFPSVSVATVDNLIGHKSLSFEPIWLTKADVINDSKIDSDSTQHLDSKIDDVEIKNFKFYFFENDTIPNPDISADIIDTTSNAIESVEIDSNLDSLNVTPIDTVISQPEMQQESIVQTTVSPTGFTRTRNVETADKITVSELPTVVFGRKTFFINGTVESASIVVSRAVLLEIYINGSQVDDGILLTSDEHTNTYDVSRLLSRGKNVLSLKADGSSSLIRFIGVGLTSVYFPEMPQERILALFNKNRQASEKAETKEPEQPVVE